MTALDLAEMVRKACRQYGGTGMDGIDLAAIVAEWERGTHEELASAHFATEIATLRRALEERTAERDALRRALPPGGDRAGGGVGEGAWSVFAGRVVEERDEARAGLRNALSERDRFRQLYERTIGQLVILRSAAKAALLAAPRVRAVTTDQLAAEDALRVAIVESDP